MFVEDVIARTAEIVSNRSHDGRFVSSLASRVYQNRPLTTRQGYAFLSFLRKNRYLWSSIPSVEEVLADPKWKNSLEESKVIHHEVRFLGDNSLGFRTNRSRATGPTLARLDAVWSQGMHVVVVNSKDRLDDVIALVGEHGFAMDKRVERYLVQALEASELSPSCATLPDFTIVDVPCDEVLGSFVLHVLQGEPL